MQVWCHISETKSKFLLRYLYLRTVGGCVALGSLHKKLLEESALRDEEHILNVFEKNGSILVYHSRS